jgi:hypothetical protein
MSFYFVVVDCASLFYDYSSLHEALYWGHTMERWQSYVVSLTDFPELWKYWICWQIPKFPLHMSREKAPQSRKHRSIAASRQQQLEQKAQEDQT